MAIAKVGTDTSGTSASLSYSFSHTLVTGTNRIVVVGIGIENQDSTALGSITYGGVNMILANSYLSGTSGARNLVGVYYLLDADLPSLGSNTVAVTILGTASSLGSVTFCAEYSGVYQSAPEATDTAYQTGSQTVTNTISPSTGAWVFSTMDCGATNGTWSHGQSQVELIDSQGTGGSHTMAVAELRSASGETSLSSTYSGDILREVRVAVSFAEASSYADPMSRVAIYQINCGGSASSPYIADTFYSGGTTASTSTAINVSGVTNPPPQIVCQDERYGNTTYTITGLTADKRYLVRLHFSENYWSGVGDRVFDVSINSTLVLDNYDILVATGGPNYTLVVEEFYAIANSSGQIIIQLTTVTDNAVIEAIEIYTTITNIWVNVSGTWKAVSDAYVNNSGTWELTNEVDVDVSGTWEQITE